jgi:hypothetical protein
LSSEYDEHETATQKAEAKIDEAKSKVIEKAKEAQLHVAEMAKHGQELKVIYSLYLMLDFCAKRYPNFSEGKDKARDVAKNKEAALAAEQINGSWNASAEAFAKIIEPLLQTTDQLYTECSGASSTLMGLIMSGVAEPSEGRLRKKDF